MLASLYPADITAIKASFVGETFLRHAQGLSLLPNAFAKYVEKRVHPTTTLDR